MNAELYPFTEEGIQESSALLYGGEQESYYNNYHNNRRENDQKSMRRRLVPHVETAVGQLISADMLPAVWFIFSRKGCDQAVDYLDEHLQTPVVCFDGPMGAGKTTLISILCKKWQVTEKTFAS